MAAQPYVMFYLLLTIIAGLVAAHAWQRRSYRSARPFTLLLAAISFWCFCRAYAMLVPSFEERVFWALLQVAGIVLVTPAWLLVVLSYSGHPWRHRRALLSAIFAPALLSFSFAITNSLHGLWWSRVEPDRSKGFLWMTVDWGPAFWAHLLGTYGLFTLSLVLLVQTALRSPSHRRWQTWLLVGGSLLPALGNLSFFVGLRTPWRDDPPPFLLLITALIGFYATMHFRMINLNQLVERAALLALPDGMIVLDTEDMVVQLNHEAARLLMVPVHPVTSQSLSELLVVSELGQALLPPLTSLNRAQPHTQLVSYDEPTGRCTVEVRSRPLEAANGAVSGALLLLRDVSERANAEQAQAQHLAELSLINQVARAANTAADTEGLVRVVAKTIAAANLWERVAVGLLGPDETRLSLVADVPTEGAGESFEGGGISGAAGAALVTILRAGQSHTLDLGDPQTANSPLGQSIAEVGLHRLLIVPLYHQGTPLGLLLLGNREPGASRPALVRVAETIGELITDAVVRTRLYDEAQQAEQLKDSFLANVSHELRTPLTSIIGYTEMLQRGMYGQPPEQMREALGFMSLASHTLLRLISDILDFSRAEAKHLQVELTAVDMLHAVANVVGQLQPQIAARGLSFELNMPPGLPRVRGNQTRIEQVLNNLLGNAVKFTERGKIGIHAWRMDKRLCTSITDTGVGIAPEHLGIIFQEFRRVETPSRRVGGTGLGLAISKRLIELMGGSIRVESTPGVGSTFTIELDIDQPAAPAQAVAHNPTGRANETEAGA